MLKKLLLFAGLLTAMASWAGNPPPTISAQQLPPPLMALYAKEKPDLGRYGHCSAAFDSRTDGMKMAISCSIYVRLSAQGERLSLKLCGERAELLKIKSPCMLIVDP